MKLIFAAEAWDDYLYWQKQDKRMVERINKLIQETQREPFAGIGKPEALKHALAGFWSRRITDEHRVVYRIEEDALLIAQLRFHYY
ncbi:MAG TPA: Txe/YoeB family addiction module toxin [bacterium]|nr:Txe/YoeB family addiction module toxin [bacterium]